MLVGIALPYFHILPPSAVGELEILLPFISALTIAFILFHVGLQIRADRLRRVLGRSLAFTFSVQVTTGIVLSLLAYFSFHWGALISFVFGFALSGPSSVAVPVLVRIARMPSALGTSLLFESVISDLLELLVPLLLLGLLVSGRFSTVHIGVALAFTLVGSALLGVAAAVAWLWILDRLGTVARAYSWTLTITMVLATYGAADYIGLSAAMTIFVFGLTLGNRQYLEFDPFAGHAGPTTLSARVLPSVRRVLRLSPQGVDVEHIQQVQREVSFFASAFFFVDIGILFHVGGLTVLVLVVPLVSTFAMLALRTIWSPLLAAYLSGAGERRRSERAIVCFNIARGLSPAVIATIPLSYGLVIPGFLDAMFLGILFSTLVSTVGISVFYVPPPADVPVGPGSPAIPMRPAAGVAPRPEEHPVPPLPPTRPGNRS